MFKTLAQTIPVDKDYPARMREIDLLTRVLEGSIYDNLQYGFHTEYTDGGEYVPIRDRRPSVKYALCKTVVKDSVALLFSEGHFPKINCDDEATQKTLQDIIKKRFINLLMIDAAIKGSVGSVAIQMRILDSRLYFDAKKTLFLTPIWKATAPDRLEKVIEKYKVKGAALKELGYSILDDELNVYFWWHREWDENQEIWMIPYFVVKDNYKHNSKMEKEPTVDPKRTVTHALGFVPWVWIKNLPGGDDIDGACTFFEAIDTSIEMDYLLSQGGRGLKYASDPTLLIKEPAFSDGTIIKGAGNAIKVSADGDAKLLEINGTASAALIEWVKFLRELALESISGNRTDASKLSAAQSGKAMELMNQALVNLADTLRITYGEGGLLSLLSMIVTASNKLELIVGDDKIGALNDSGLALVWPAWYAPTATDSLAKSQALKTGVDGGFMSTETAVNSLAADYDVEDPKKELLLIKTEIAERAKLLQTENNL